MLNHIVGILIEETIKEIPFEQWLKGKKFVDVDTKKPSPFIMLSVKQRIDIKKQYEREESKRVETEKANIESARIAREASKKREREEKREIDRNPYHKDYPWTRKKLEKETDDWGQSLASDSPEFIEDACSDLAQNFLFQYRGVRNFLLKDRIPSQYHQEHIADLIHDAATRKR
ncbi:MAG: hypothetical protein HQK96_18515 [Nitrospirae bacterium]|nr:hypothetical protein [Nitrospirota bacterium]